MSNAAKKYIPGLGQSFYVSPEHITSEGTADKYIPGLGTEFKIHEDCINPKGGAEKYIPGLGRQFTIALKHTEGGILISAIEGAEGASVDITVTTTGGTGSVTLKYLEGEKAIADFVTGGTTITGGKFSVSANGKYTIYAKDSIGRESILVVNVTKVTGTV